MHSFSVGFLFGGSGIGALGFLKAVARLKGQQARFRNLGGIDNDPAACADFERLTGGKATCADLSTMTPAELRAALGDESPDGLFLSPPCKGFSRLLSKKSAASPKYQALNRLVLQGLFLACEAWSRPPGLIVLENVPGIASRGAELLAQVRQLLGGYGYLFHEGFHDCGEVGGLAQHRRRYLLVARQKDRVPAFVYQPPKKRVRGCGEVLGQLPLPEDPGAGELHRLPRLSWINWVRLALIPAGGDWRDLPKAGAAAAPLKDKGERAFHNQYKVTGFDEPAKTITSATRPGNGAAAVADPRLSLPDNPDRHEAKYRVGEWDDPAHAVTGARPVTSGGPSVADPRVPLAQTAAGADSFRGRPGLMGVTEWDEPSPTVGGKMIATGGSVPASVADPRLATPLAPGEERRAVFGRHQVLAWNEPTGVVAGSGSNGAVGIADPRVGGVRFSNKYKVRGFDQPAGTVTGDTDIQEGAPSVADPRVAVTGERWPSCGLGVDAWDAPAHTVRGASRVSTATAAVADPRLPLGHEPRRNALGVKAWDEPSGAVRGRADVRTAPAAVQDPRVALTCECRNGFYGVGQWDQPAATVTGSLQVDNGPAAVADPRCPPIPPGYRLMTIGQALAAADHEKAPPAGLVPVILSPTDGTWHRPLTTLELAALQGLPAQLDGKPLALAGRSVARWRERIGNAVPVGAGQAIAEQLLLALLAARLETWTLGGTGIWVRRRSPAALHALEVARA